MIPRYKIEEISRIWSTENKLSTWLKVELAHIESLYNLKENDLIDQKEYNDIINNVKVDKERWKIIEEETRHDFQAFVQMLEETIPNNSGRWLHYGLTSSDILDTSLVLMCKESLKIVKNYCADTLFHLNYLLKRNESDSLLLGRTHGKNAEQQKYYNVFERWIESLRRGYDEVSRIEKLFNYGKLSGVIGNNTLNSLANENYALEILGLKRVKSSQIIPREIFLDYYYSMLKIIISVEKIAYDIRIYSIDGINEMSEPFYEKQKGSSAMPHKKNPVMCENICGLTRLYKSYFNTAIENCNTLLERDITHSSSERIIFKDSAHITCFVLKRLSIIIKNLNILEKNAEENLKKDNEKLNSQETMCNYIKSGKSRSESHNISQNISTD